jgi:uncharacterized protein
MGRQRREGARPPGRGGFTGDQPANALADQEQVAEAVSQPRTYPPGSGAPVAWNFSDLHTNDPAAAEEFYAAVFGWEAAELDFGATMWRAPGYGDHLEATVDPDIRSRQGAAPGTPPDEWG